MSSAVGHHSLARVYWGASGPLVEAKGAQVTTGMLTARVASLEQVLSWSPPSCLHLFALSDCIGQKGFVAQATSRAIPSDAIRERDTDVA